jgi:hypothetical protein
MQFFIPGIFLFVLAIAITFIIAPRATPLVSAILSIGFLGFGVYEHYKLFAAEYRLSTWQDSLKMYAPAIMISAIIIFIIYTILALFTKGAVPVPPIPNIEVPSANTATDQLVKAVNTVMNTVTNTKNDVLTSVNKTINNINKNRTNIFNTLNGNKINELKENKGENERRNNNLSRSFLETI